MQIVGRNWTIVSRIQFSILFSSMTIRVAFDYFGTVPVSYDKRCDIQRQFYNHISMINRNHLLSMFKYPLERDSGVRNGVLEVT